MEYDVIKLRLNEVLNSTERMSLRLDSELSDSTSLLTDLALDSIQLLELIVCIEKEFGIQFNTDEIDLAIFDRVEDLVKFVQKTVVANRSDLV